MTERTNGHIHSLPLFEGVDEAKRHTWVLLVRTFQLIHRRIVSALARHDVTMPQFDVLATLRFNEGVTQQELAERLLVTKGNVCGVLNRLEAVGWVERRPDPDDRRANRLRLSAAGRRKINALLPEHDSLVVEAMKSLSNGDVASLRTLLNSLAEANDAAA